MHTCIHTHIYLNAYSNTNTQSIIPSIGHSLSNCFICSTIDWFIPPFLQSSQTGSQSVSLPFIAWFMHALNQAHICTARTQALKKQCSHVRILNTHTQFLTCFVSNTTAVAMLQNPRCRAVCRTDSCAACHQLPDFGCSFASQLCFARLYLRTLEMIMY